MIYLDVTSSCKSPVNTGVQRAVRGIFRSLTESRAALLPVAWDAGLRSYCALSGRERGFLETPFGGRRQADAEPGRRANPAGVLSRAARALRRRWQRVDVEAGLKAGATLFVPEIFQDNRVETLPGWPGRKAAVCHDAIAWRRPEITPAANAAGVREYLVALGRMSMVIAVSQETREHLTASWRKMGQAPAPVSVLGWPVDHAGHARPPAAAGAAGSCPSILCVGTFEPRKNHLTLLEAAGRLWDGGLEFELILVGRTTPGWGAKVIAAVETLQKAGRPVRWLRHVDDATLDEAYARASFTVFPSLAEGFGLPVIESLWHGRPCLCGANGALGEVSQAGGCLQVDQTQAIALAAGMERLLKDHACRRRLAEEAQGRKFDRWEDYAPKVLALLAGREG